MIDKYIDIKNLVTGILVAILSTIILWFFGSGERLYNSITALLLISIIGYLIFYKTRESSYVFLSSIENFWARGAIFLVISAFLFTFIFDIKLSVRTDKQPQFDVVSPVAYPDSAVIIHGINVSKSKKLDVELNGIEFKSVAYPLNKENGKIWKFDPYNRENIPDGLVKYGESVIRVGVNGEYYTEEIKIFIDSTSNKDKLFQKLKVDKGWNLLAFRVSDSVRVDSLFSNISGSPIKVVKNEAGRMYSKNTNISTLKYIVPNEAYKVYSTSDTTILVNSK